jgi:DNA-directed RNA polymerase subunit RPC12/RpoP
MPLREGDVQMKINCLSCGHSVELDEAYSDYEGPIKCYTCSALLEVKLEENLIKSVKFLKLTRSAAGEI